MTPWIRDANERVNEVIDHLPLPELRMPRASLWTLIKSLWRVLARAGRAGER